MQYTGLIAEMARGGQQLEEEAKKAGRTILAHQVELELVPGADGKIGFKGLAGNIRCCEVGLLR